MMERFNHHRFSAGAELAIGIGSCFTIIGAIFLHMFLVGPIGGNGPASHAGAGLGEIALAILTVSLFTSGTIVRLVYRAWPIRWLKVVSVTYLGILIFSVGIGFIDVGCAFVMVFFTITAGLAASILLLLSYCVKRLAT